MTDSRPAKTSWFPLACALIALATTSGCSSTPGKPIVDMKGVNAYQYEQDLAECSEYADEVNMAGKTVGGAAAGAAVGAAVGAIWDGHNGNSPERGRGHRRSGWRCRWRRQRPQRTQPGG